MVFPISLWRGALEAMRYDAAIIGSGVAGGLAATHLARMGAKVIVIEKEKVAHHKVCGEFISYEAHQYLVDLGIDLPAFGAQPIHFTRLVSGRHAVTASLPFRGLSLSRRALDAVLLAKAIDYGAVIRTGVTATKLAYENAGWTVACGENENIIAKSLFLATGKHDMRDWPRAGGKHNAYIGFKMHFCLADRQREKIARHTELYFSRGGYAGLQPVEADRANFCLLVRKDHFARSGKNWDGLIQMLAQSMPLLAERLDGAAPAWAKPLAVFGVPYGFIHRPATNEPPDLYRLGDQMAVIPSFCGDGIAIAMHTARLAAECYRYESSQSYAVLAYMQLRRQIAYATWIARVLAVPGIQPAALALSRKFPGIIAHIARQTRLHPAAAGGKNLPALS